MTFYDDNQLKSFPLVGDGANDIPDDVVVDCIVHAPSMYGFTLQLLSISVTELIVSVVLGIDETPVAYVTVLQSDLETHRPLALIPIVPAVSGFVAFGEGVRSQRLRVDGVYPFLDTSYIAFEYDITFPTVQAGGHEWFGLVKLQAGTGLSITARELRIMREDDEVVNVTAALVGLADSALLSEPLAQCIIPAEGPARVKPLLSINDVQPDCSGGLTLEVVTVKQLPTVADVSRDNVALGIAIIDGGTPCGS